LQSNVLPLATPATAHAPPKTGGRGELHLCSFWIHSFRCSFATKNSLSFDDILTADQTAAAAACKVCLSPAEGRWNAHEMLLDATEERMQQGPETSSASGQVLLPLFHPSASERPNPLTDHGSTEYSRELAPSVSREGRRVGSECLSQAPSSPEELRGRPWAASACSRSFAHICKEQTSSRFSLLSSQWEVQTCHAPYL